MEVINDVEVYHDIFEITQVIGNTHFFYDPTVPVIKAMERSAHDHRIFIVFNIGRKLYFIDKEGPISLTMYGCDIDYLFNLQLIIYSFLRREDKGTPIHSCLKEAHEQIKKLAYDLSMH